MAREDETSTAVRVVSARRQYLRLRDGRTVSPTQRRLLLRDGKTMALAQRERGTKPEI